MPVALDASELDRIYELLLELIKKAGNLAMEGFNSDPKIVNTKKGKWDMVTHYDRAVEELLIAGIRKQYPSHK